MSRIFGRRTSRSDGVDPAVIARQAAALSRAVGRPAVVTSAFAAVGWVGTGTPRVCRDRGLTVVLDGRIYNRQELGTAGTDADAFLQLYRRRGFEAAMQAVNGDLAVAVVDEGADRLWLGRDRVGSKPLYWTRLPDGIAFASQPGGLLVVPSVSHAVDREFVALVAGSHYRTFDNAIERSPYNAIAQLSAGHVLEAGPTGVSVRRYWDLDDRGDVAVDEPELAARYRTLLADAVAIRLATSSRPAFTLSGGMDSSSVLASAVEAAGATQHAFSSVYRDPTYDETEEIRSMLDVAVDTWHPVRVEDPDLLAAVGKLVAIHEEPVATATWLSHWVVSEHVAAGRFDTLFGGLGGDEINAGEYEYFVFHFADLRAQGRDDDLAHEVERWAAHHDHPIWRKDAAVMESMLARRIDPARPGGNLPDIDRLRQYVGAVRPEWYDLRTYLPVMDHPFGSHLKNRAYQDLFRETTPCCLRAEDRHAAALGIEHADPFLDHRLLELLFAVPGDRKIRDGVTKVLLREAMRGVLPEETRTRIAKTGWNAPAHLWFTGASGDAVRDLIESPGFTDRGIYDVGEARRLLTEHQAIVASGAPRENHMMFFWQLVNLELWLQWLDGVAA